MHKAPEAKSPRMKIVLPPETFQEHLDAALGKSGHARQHMEIVQDALNKAKNDLFRFDQAVTRLKRIEWLTKSYGSVNVMDWRSVEPGGMSVNVESRHQEEMETSMLRAVVYIDKRNDMKKMNQHVKIQVWRRELSDDHSGRTTNGGYIDYDYGKEKYGEDVVDQKFKSLQEADAFVEHWQNVFYADHKEEIDFDRAMRELILK